MYNSIIGGQILKWIKNLESIIDKNTPGNCPVCNTINTYYSMHIIDNKKNMGYGVIWCNDCKNAFHISRIKVSSNMKKHFGYWRIKVLSNSKVYLDVTIVEYVPIKSNFNIKQPKLFIGSCH